MEPLIEIVPGTWVDPTRILYAHAQHTGNVSPGDCTLYIYLRVDGDQPLEIRVHYQTGDEPWLPQRADGPGVREARQILGSADLLPSPRSSVRPWDADPFHTGSDWPRPR